MIRVLIADDHPIVRQGLKQTLAEAANISVQDEAKNGFEVIEKLKRQAFDVVLLDVSMPDKNGVEVIKQLRAAKDKTPVLMLSTHPENQYAIRSLKAGASGYLTKSADEEELIKAITKVAAGGKYISEKLAEQLAMDVNKDYDKPLHQLLSDREYDVLCRIASGESVSQIGDELSLSIKTISTYRSRILEKMNMKNNAELTYYAIKNNLTS